MIKILYYYNNFEFQYSYSPAANIAHLGPYTMRSSLFVRNMVKRNSAIFYILFFDWQMREHL